MVNDVFTPRLNGRFFDHALGKVVCVGRNYAAHARELGNSIPERPLLFIKPSSSVVDFNEPLVLPEGMGCCHHELEIAILIGKPLCKAVREQVGAAIAGIGLGLDLTLRDLQQSLKENNHPWERAKGFDGACPLSTFVLPEGIDLERIDFSLHRNGSLQQQGHSCDMLIPIEDLLVEISQCFSLFPGDVVLTGTPEGVGPLQGGDQLVATLLDRIVVDTFVDG